MTTEPCCYKVEMEKEKAKKLKLWMEVTDERIVAHLPKDDQAAATKIHSEISRSTSEILISSTNYEGYEIKRTNSKYIIQDVASPVSSVGTLAPRSLFRQDVELIEPEPEELIPAEGPRQFGLSRSCINVHKYFADQFLPPVRSTSSCHDFSTHSDVLPKKTLNFEGLQLYNEARIIFESYLKSLQLPNDFQEVELQFFSLYPNYWRHLRNKCNVYITPQIAADELEALTDIVETCTGTLEDEMEIEKTETIRDIGITGNDLYGDFRIAVMYLKKKYPYLFAYMMRKHDFELFAKERYKVNRNRFELSKFLELEPDLLVAREGRYATPEFQ